MSYKTKDAETNERCCLGHCKIMTNEAAAHTRAIINRLLIVSSEKGSPLIGLWPGRKASCTKAVSRDLAKTSGSRNEKTVTAVAERIYYW